MVLIPQGSIVPAKQHGMTFDVALVTPEIAGEWLKVNHCNRKLRKSHIKRMSTIIANNGWQLTHQGVAFNKKGDLVDGQNRLMAIVQSGKAVPIVVCRGVDADSPIGLMVDLGAKRSTADVLHIHQHVAEICNFITRVLIGRDQTPDQVAVVVAKFGLIIEELSEKCSTMKRIRSSSPVRTAVVLNAIVTPESKDEIFDQYRHFVLMDDPTALWPSLMSLFRATEQGRLTGRDSKLFCYAFTAFTPSNRNLQKVGVRDCESLAIQVRESLNLIVYGKQE